MNTELYLLLSYNLREPLNLDNLDIHSFIIEHLAFLHIKESVAFVVYKNNISTSVPIGDSFRLGLDL